MPSFSRSIALPLVAFALSTLGTSGGSSPARADAPIGASIAAANGPTTQAPIPDELVGSWQHLSHGCDLRLTDAELDRLAKRSGSGGAADGATLTLSARRFVLRTASPAGETRSLNRGGVHPAGDAGDYHFEASESLPDETSGMALSFGVQPETKDFNLHRQGNYLIARQRSEQRGGSGGDCASGQDSVAYYVLTPER